jgi:DNA polymerase delta subunit 4
MDKHKQATISTYAKVAKARPTPALTKSRKSALPTPPTSSSLLEDAPPSLIDQVKHEFSLHHPKSPIHWDGKDPLEMYLCYFDLDMAYGPCVGISRRVRWNRANTCRLNPPPLAMDILDLSDMSDRCLWSTERV